MVCAEAVWVNFVAPNQKQDELDGVYMDEYAAGPGLLDAGLRMS
jgi:hypothetical protein